MNYLKAILLAGCVMMSSPTITLADDLNDAENGLLPIQFDKKPTSTTNDDRRLAGRQLEQDDVPETVPLSQFNSVFQDYMNKTPGSSRGRKNQASGNRQSQIASSFDARGRGGGGARKAARRAKMKARFDTNGDGVLDDNERAQMKEWRQQRKGNRQNGGGGMHRKGKRGRKHQGDGQGGAPSGTGAGFSGFSDRGPSAGSNGFSDNGLGPVGAGTSPDWQAPAEHRI